MNNLTIEDIHKIREENANQTQNMNFDDYKAQLNKEIKPLLAMLKTMKASPKPYSFDVEHSIAAEQETEYKTKK